MRKPPAHAYNDAPATAKQTAMYALMLVVATAYLLVATYYLVFNASSLMVKALVVVPMTTTTTTTRRPLPRVVRSDDVWLLLSSRTHEEEEEDKEWESLLQRWKEEHERDDDDDTTSVVRHWAAEQRLLYKTDRLPLRRFHQLKAVGFFSNNDVCGKGSYDNWETMYDELVLFRDEHGHCNVDGRQHLLEYPALVVWVLGQREWRCRKNLYLPGKEAEEFLAQRVRQLDAIGFDWQSDDYFFGSATLDEEELQRRWTNKLGELVQFHEKHGHFDVPHFYFENPSLGFFVKSQRSWPKGAWGEYPRVWKDELDRIGFTWEMQ